MSYTYISCKCQPDPAYMKTRWLRVTYKSGTPKCPNCRKLMVIRRNTLVADHAEFWGCAGWPNCRGTRDIWRIKNTCDECGERLVRRSSNREAEQHSGYDDCRAAYEDRLGDTHEDLLGGECFADRFLVDEYFDIPNR